MRLIHRFVALGLCLIVVSYSGVYAASATKSNPPATLDKPGDELALNRIKITAKAKERLGIKLVPVESQSITRYRMYSGEILLPVVDDNKVTGGAQDQQSVVGIIGLMNPFGIGAHCGVPDRCGWQGGCSVGTFEFTGELNASVPKNWLRATQEAKKPWTKRARTMSWRQLICKP